MEDKALYPKLLASDKTKVRQTAESFLNEMGNLNQTFGDYLKRWNSVLKIKAQYGQFRLETQTILTALTQRIAREDQELYEMADKEFDIGNFIK
jgi:hemerythrin-like domain-containing protein